MIFYLGNPSAQIEGVQTSLDYHKINPFVKLEYLLFFGTPFIKFFPYQPCNHHVKVDLKLRINLITLF